MTAIAASSVSMKTMSDGTLRISFDIEPINAQAAFKLFATPGTQVAIAALLDGSYLAQKPDEVEPVKEKMGDACWWTVMRCNEPLFLSFLKEKHPHIFVSNKENANEAVKLICDVASRKELDSDKRANVVWNQLIREPYRLYLQSKGPAQ